MAKSMEDKVLYNFFYMVAKDVLDNNGKCYTPYELSEVAESMADSESISEFRSHYEDMILEALDNVE